MASGINFVYAYKLYKRIFLTISWRIFVKTKMKRFFLIAGLAGLFFIFPVLFNKPTFASFNFVISEVSPSTVTSKDQEIDVKIKVESLPSGESFFRASIKSGNSYLGYMQNNSGNWVKMGSLTSDSRYGYCVNYYKISTDGEYVLKIKVGSDNDLANGKYTVKVHRFTSSCASYSYSSEETDFEVEINLPTPTPTPAQSQSTSSSASTVTISKPRKQDDTDVLGAKIYIDGSYTGNYAPQTYTFGDGKNCGTNNVPCGFGTHTFKVEKTGYIPWTKTAEIISGNNYEFDPVLLLVSPTNSPTAKPTPTATASATPKSTIANFSTSTESGLLAEDVFSNKSVLGAESFSKTPPPSEENIPVDPKLKAAILFLITAGVSFLASAVYAYIRSKKQNGEKANEVEEGS